MPWSDHLPRIPLIPDMALTPDQAAVYQKIVDGPRGTLVGPLRAALHAPELADKWQAFGEVLRYRTSLPHALKELAICIAGRYWSSEIEWYVHAREALDAGIAVATIDAIGELRSPQLSGDELCIYEYTRELLHEGHVTQRVYDSARERFGVVGIVELTALIGYYTMVAMTLNAHEVPVPANGQGVPLPRLQNGSLRKALLPPALDIAAIASATANAIG